MNLSKHYLLLVNTFLLYLSMGFNISFASINNINNLANTDIPLRIAVASNFTPIIKELLLEFHKETHIKTQIISGASGALFLQIKHGAPFDIFISADSTRPEQLEQQKLILPNSRKTYAIGQLALLSMNKTAKLSNLPQIPTHFAIANPDTAPYGKAAKQTLQHLGLWQQYQNNLITGINISQTFTQVRSQAVNSGLVANSQLVINKLVGVVIPSNYHQPIQQQLVIIKQSKSINNAKKLSDFLLSPTIQQKIVNYGYTNNVISKKQNKQINNQFNEFEKSYAKP
jgi:molybdate transport system substrate-binding protein